MLKHIYDVMMTVTLRDQERIYLQNLSSQDSLGSYQRCRHSRVAKRTATKTAEWI